MSIAQIDRWLYDALYWDRVAHYINEGLDQWGARQMAQTEMDHSFVPDDLVACREDQRDADEFGFCDGRGTNISRNVLRGGTSRDSLK